MALTHHCAMTLSDVGPGFRCRTRRPVCSREDDQENAALTLLDRRFQESELGNARPIPGFEGSPATALEIVVVAGLGLDLGPLPNRTASAFDFRRHRPNMRPRQERSSIVVGTNPHLRRDLPSLASPCARAACIAASRRTGISAPPQVSGLAYRAGPTEPPFAASRSRFVRLSDAKTSAFTPGSPMPTVK